MLSVKCSPQVFEGVERLIHFVVEYVDSIEGKILDSTLQLYRETRGLQPQVSPHDNGHSIPLNVASATFTRVGVNFAINLPSSTKT